MFQIESILFGEVGTGECDLLIISDQINPAETLPCQRKTKHFLHNQRCVLRDEATEITRGPLDKLYKFILQIFNKLIFIPNLKKSAKFKILNKFGKTWCVICVYVYLLDVIMLLTYY